MTVSEQLTARRHAVLNHPRPCLLHSLMFCAGQPVDGHAIQFRGGRWVCECGATGIVELLH